MQFNFVVATNEAAIQLWTSLGFAIVGRVPGAFRHAKLGLVDALVMHRGLTTIRPVAADDHRDLLRAAGRSRRRMRWPYFPRANRDAFKRTGGRRFSANPTGVTRTILDNGRVAGNVVIFGPPEERLVGYWIGREYWGKGIATRGLALLLDEIAERPLFAHVAKTNVGSVRVLEKCGFTVTGEEPRRRRRGMDHEKGDTPLFQQRGHVHRTKRLSLSTLGEKGSVPFFYQSRMMPIVRPSASLLAIAARRRVPSG